MGLVVGLANTGTAVSVLLPGAAPLDLPFCDDRPWHPPIRIAEDHGLQGFTWNDPRTGNSVYRPGSGVVAGAGTPEAPFVIGGWCIGLGAIVRPPLPLAAVEIAGTHAYVVIRDNTITGMGTDSLEDYGVYVRKAEHVRVSQNRLLASHWGVLALASTDVRIDHNEVRGNANALSVQDVGSAVVEGNDVRDSDSGITAWFSHAVAIRGNLVAQSVWDGIYLHEPHSALVEDNAVDDATNGIVFFESTDSTARNNVVTRTTGDGILFWGSTGAIVEGNVATDHERYSIRLDQGAADARVERNVATRSEHGLAIAGDTANVVVRQNALYGNRDRIGLDAQFADSTIDARWNWWGCAEGPAAPKCDGVRGDVDYDPWLASFDP